MLSYCCGTVTVSAKLSHGYFAHKVHESNEGNQYECILLSCLEIV